MRRKSNQNRRRGDLRNIMGEVASVFESCDGVKATVIVGNAQ